MIPPMWAPYFIGGGTPKATLDKIELMIASVVPADRGLSEFISQWGRYARVASGLFGAEVNDSSVGTSWQDFPRGVEYNSWAEGKGFELSTVWQVLLHPLWLRRQELAISICEWLKSHRHRHERSYGS